MNRFREKRNITAFLVILSESKRYLQAAAS